MAAFSYELFEKLIRKEIDAHIARAVDEEIEVAKKRVEDRIHAELATIAVRIASHYEMSMDRHSIVVRIENKTVDNVSPPK